MNERAGPTILALRAGLERPAKAGASVADRAYVLHTWPWRETSAIAEVFTAGHGRVGLIAKGAKRPKSAIRGVLQPFQPLLLNWFGKSEMKTLKGAEQQRFLPQLSGAALVSAFYLNELVFKLTHREVPHEALFDAYEAAIETLAGARGAAGRHGGGEPLGRAGLSREDIAATLRVFEVALMRELGYGLRFEEEAASHAPIVAECRYWYAAERGAVLASAGHERPQDALELSGKTMIDMARGDYRDPVTLAESKLLMRHLISRLLGGKVLFSRALMREMK